jgi:hypothetical protein
LKTPKLRILLILIFSLSITASYQYYLNQGVLLIASLANDEFYQKTVENILLSIAGYTALVASAPVIFVVLRKYILSLVSLVVTTSIYLTIISGVNFLGVALAILAFGFVIYILYSKAKLAFQYFRAKH